MDKAAAKRIKNMVGRANGTTSTPPDEYDHHPNEIPANIRPSPTAPLI